MLPKAYYSPDGHIYGKNIVYGERKTMIDKANKEKDMIANERAKEKISRQIKEANLVRERTLKERYENSRLSGGGKGRSR